MSSRFRFKLRANAGRTILGLELRIGAFAQQELDSLPLPCLRPTIIAVIPLL
jgi:hypothetical protein